MKIYRFYILLFCTLLASCGGGGAKDNGDIKTSSMISNSSSSVSSSSVSSLINTNSNLKWKEKISSGSGLTFVVGSQGYFLVAETISDAPIKYTSLDTSVVKILSTGELQFQSLGEAVIEASVAKTEKFEAAKITTKINVVSGKVSLTALVGTKETDILLPEGFPAGLMAFGITDLDNPACDINLLLRCVGDSVCEREKKCPDFTFASFGSKLSTKFSNLYNDKYFTFIKNGTDVLAVTEVAAGSNPWHRFSADNIRASVRKHVRFNNIYYAIRSDGWLLDDGGKCSESLVKSNDGVTWSPIKEEKILWADCNSNDTPSPYLFVYKNMLHAVAYDINKEKLSVWKSENGSNWTIDSAINVDSYSPLYSCESCNVFELNDELVVFRNDWKIKKTKNLIVWQEVALPYSSAYGRFVFFKNSIYYLGDYSSNEQVVLSSNDGVIWKKEATFPQGFYIDPLTVSATNTSMYFVGKEVGVNGRKIYTSSDGKIFAPMASSVMLNDGDYWQSFSNRVMIHSFGGSKFLFENNLITDLSDPIAPPNGVPIVEFKGKLWAIGGNDISKDGVMDIYSSSDLFDWTKHACDPQQNCPTFGRREGHQLVVFNGKLWLLGGYGRGVIGGAKQYLNDIWQSDDGLHWAQITTSQPFTAREGFDVAKYNGNTELWVSGGKEWINSINSEKESRSVFSSVDGKNWVKRIVFDDYIKLPDGVSIFDSYLTMFFSGKEIIFGGSLYLKSTKEITFRLNNCISNAEGKSVTLYAGNNKEVRCKFSFSGGLLQDQSSHLITQYSALSSDGTYASNWIHEPFKLVHINSGYPATVFKSEDGGANWQYIGKTPIHTLRASVVPFKFNDWYAFRDAVGNFWVSIDLLDWRMVKKYDIKFH